MLPCLSLFFLVFICIFPAWLMGDCDFRLSCSGFMGDKFFSLSLMLFGGQIGDLCNGCFVGDFALLRIVRVGVVDPPRVCLDYNIGSLTIPNLFLSRCWVKLSRV